MNLYAPVAAEAMSNRAAWWCCRARRGRIVVPPNQATTGTDGGSGARGGYRSFQECCSSQPMIGDEEARRPRRRFASCSEAFGRARRSGRRPPHRFLQAAGGCIGAGSRTDQRRRHRRRRTAARSSPVEIDAAGPRAARVWPCAAGGPCGLAAARHRVALDANDGCGKTDAPICSSIGHARCCRQPAFGGRRAPAACALWMTRRSSDEAVMLLVLNWQEEATPRLGGVGTGPEFNAG